MTNKVYGLPCSICPSSDAVTKYPDGWKKCYSCDKWTPPKESMSGKCVQISDNSFEFPGDYSTDIPIEYHNWFTQYGLSVDDVHCYKFGYSMKVKRIIIPLDDNKKKWIGRRVYNWQSKYITPTGQSYAPFKAYGDGYNLILVEDCLSAIKVSLATNLGPSWALLGVGNRKIGGMVRKLNPKKVYIWMDGDIAGIRGAKKLYNWLSLYFDCDIILTEKDPKEYNLEEIREFLSGKKRKEMQ